MQNAPWAFGALETHSRQRQLGIVSTRSGMALPIGQEFVFFEASVLFDGILHALAPLPVEDASAVASAFYVDFHSLVERHAILVAIVELRRKRRGMRTTTPETTLAHFSFRESDNTFQRATPLSTSTRSLQGGQ
jgi:hypothetical protein